MAHIVGASQGADWFPGISAGLRARGYDLTAVIDDRPGDLQQRLAAADVPTARCGLSLRRPLAGRTRLAPLGYPADAARLLGCTIQLRRLLRSMRPDVVLTHLFNATIIGRLAAASARVPLRMAMVPAPIVLEAAVPRQLERLTLSLDHAVVAGSERIRGLYREMGVAAERIELAYYGADARVFDPGRVSGEGLRAELGLSADVPLVGQVAHFYAPWRGPVAPTSAHGRGVKGHEVFLHMARELRARCPNVVFLLVGGARGSAAEAYRETVKRLASELGLDNCVRFLGERRDVPEILSALDVSVQCSLSENLGGAIESLLMGVPMVASRVGGLPEAVVDGQTGILVEPGSPLELAKAVRSLLEDRRWAGRLGQAGRDRMLAGFTLEHTLDELDRVIGERLPTAAPTAAARRGG